MKKSIFLVLVSIMVLVLCGSAAATTPIADFSATPTSGTGPLDVSFTDLSTGEPTSYTWDFGDGYTSTDQNPTHRYNTPGTYNVKLTVTNADGSDEEVKSGLITVTAEADVGVTNSFIDTDWNPITTAKTGDRVINLIKVKNNGPQTATNVNINIPTPTGLELSRYWTYYGGQWILNDGTYNPTTGWNIPTINSGETKQIAIVYFVTGNGTITSTATKTTQTEPDTNTNNNQATATITSFRGADVGVTNSFIDTNWNPITTAKTGDRVITLIKVKNNGPQTATNVNINIPTPTGLELFRYFTYYGGQWILNDGTYNPTTGWNIPTINSGETIQIAIVYFVTGNGTITSTATKTTQTEPDTNTNNNQATATIINEADIGVTNSFIDTDWNPITTAKTGDRVITLIKVKNNGPQTATNVNINIPTPTGLELFRYFTYYGGQWILNDGTYNPTTGWNIPTINSGETIQIAIIYDVTGSGTITSTATKTTQTEPDTNTNNNQATTTITI